MLFYFCLKLLQCGSVGFVTMQFHRFLLNRQEYDFQSNLSALYCMTARSNVRRAAARCGTLADGGTVLSAVVVAATCVADRLRNAWRAADRLDEGCGPAARRISLHSFGVVM